MYFKHAVLRLVYAGKILNDTQTLADCDVQNNATVRLVRLLDD